MCKVLTTQVDRSLSKPPPTPKVGEGCVSDTSLFAFQCCTELVPAKLAKDVLNSFFQCDKYLIKSWYVNLHYYYLVKRTVDVTANVHLKKKNKQTNHEWWYTPLKASKWSPAKGASLLIFAESITVISLVNKMAALTLTVLIREQN